VLIVDDHPLMRKAIRAMIDAQTDMRTCGEAASAKEALEQAVETRPDLVLTDLSLPDGSGLDLIRDLKERHPQLPVVVLSMHDELLYAERVMRAGAAGYLMKHEPPERLMEGLRTVLRGESFFSPRVAASVMNTFVGGSPRSGKQGGMESLSDRELQMFVGIGGGLSTRQLAEKCGISPKTVETYRCNIKRKLRLNKGHDLLHAALRWVEDEAAGKAGAGAGE